MIGSPLTDFQNKVTSLKAVISPNSIKGSIMYIDSYGNAQQI